MRDYRSRSLLLGLAGLLTILALVVPLVAQSTAAGTLVFIGTYSSPASKGIYVSRLDPSTGALSTPTLAAEVRNPSFLASSPDGRFLYAVSEVDAVGGQPGGAVAGYAIDKAAGTLKALNTQSTVGTGPCHVSVAGRMVFAANYGGGSIAAFPMAADGTLKPASTFVQHKGSSVNKDRQAGPHDAPVAVLMYHVIDTAQRLLRERRRVDETVLGDAGRLDERRDHPDLTAPAAVRPVGGDRYLHPVAAPAFQLVGVEEVTGGPRAYQQHDPAIPGPVGERAEYHRAQRREADPARHDHDVPPGGGRHVPTGAERAAHADEAAGRRGVQRPGDRAHRAQRVLQPAGPPAGAITETAHRDGDLADAERGQHGELPRREGRDRLGRFGQLQGDRVGGVFAAGNHPVKPRHRGRLGRWLG
jgi:hypothetical protein